MGSSQQAVSVVVTGAAGYIGRHVVSALLDRGHAVVAVVRPGRSGEVDPRARIVEADILAPDFDPVTVFEEVPDVFIHLAWQDGFSHNAPSHMLALSSHYRLITAMADLGVQRISVLGTMHEIGYWEGAIDADTPPSPRSLYGIAKNALRQAVLLSLPGQAEVAWLRCYYIYGDDRRNNSIFTRLLEAVDRGQDTLPFTSGLNKYDFIEVHALAEQIAVASLTSGVSGIVNCSSGNPVSLGDQVEAFIQENRLPISLEYGAFPDRPYDSPAVWGDATRIRQIMTDAGGISGR
ncbi:NAD(P)-dependent oxidoreductase [Microbacterium invictum]|uniref:NAD(P)-dependent oxidoreductase n=1 Tax=Microbacterium invictum TaxID=515415 RepID=A0ABZ0V9V1_9MICO|nr:NAD(P)-dependent oxidoreductase [Microbacterium invictum]WQB69481.1 NAD(P)-dependent oxidoreductase [Microbacterium invictum]